MRQVDESIKSEDGHQKSFEDIQKDYAQYVKDLERSKLEKLYSQCVNSYVIENPPLQISEAIPFLLDYLARHPQITVAVFDGNKYPVPRPDFLEVAKALARSNTTLLNLTMDNTLIGNAGAKALAQLSKVTFLQLIGNQIDDIGVESLAKNTNLSTLTLQHNSVSGRGAYILAQHSKILILDLRRQTLPLPDAGIFALANSPLLQTLCLTINGISEAASIKLFQNTKITSLFLEHCTSEIIQRLVVHNKAVTNLNIDFSPHLSLDDWCLLAKHTPLLKLAASHCNMEENHAKALMQSDTLLELNAQNNPFFQSPWHSTAPKGSNLFDKIRENKSKSRQRGQLIYSHLCAYLRRNENENLSNLVDIVADYVAPQDASMPSKQERQDMAKKTPLELLSLFSPPPVAAQAVNNEGRRCVIC